METRIVGGKQRRILSNKDGFCVQPSNWERGRKSTHLVSKAPITEGNCSHSKVFSSYCRSFCRMVMSVLFKGQVIILVLDRRTLLNLLATYILIVKMQCLFHLPYSWTHITLKKNLLQCSLGTLAPRLGYISL